MTVKRQREEEVVSLALSLSTTTTDNSPASSSSSGAAQPAKRARRRGPLVATSGEGDFVCKTCSRAFTSFQALGGHRTSHLRGRHGLDLGVVGAKALKQHKAVTSICRGDDGEGKPAVAKRPQHECHICGLGFEMGQALGGHMRRHREEMAGADAADQWVWRPQELPVAAAAADPPVLLELFA